MVLNNGKGRFESVAVQIKVTKYKKMDGLYEICTGIIYRCSEIDFHLYKILNMIGLVTIEADSKLTF